MTSRDFCYWLMGYFEIADGENQGTYLPVEKVQIIKKHLALVFKYEIDPSMGNQEHQQELNKIHDDLIRC